MIINSVEFVGSFPNVGLCPQESKPEYAFIGRSNVGKSSLINLLMDRRDMARVSNQPGKTQELNYYLINNSWNLVDLPGYGYAKRSKKIREVWAKALKRYLLERKQLVCVCLLVDGSIPPQKIDLEFMGDLGEKGIPFALIFTKVDKAKPKEFEILQEKYMTALSEMWEPLPTYFHTSATKRLGREELLTFIEGINQKYEQVAFA